MDIEKKYDLKENNSSCLNLINLNIEAEKIKSSYKIRACIQALVEFVGRKNYSYSN